MRESQKHRSHVIEGLLLHWKSEYVLHGLPSELMYIMRLLVPSTMDYFFWTQLIENAITLVKSFFTCQNQEFLICDL